LLLLLLLHGAARGKAAGKMVCGGRIDSFGKGTLCSGGRCEERGLSADALSEGAAAVQCCGCSLMHGRCCSLTLRVASAGFLISGMEMRWKHGGACAGGRSARSRGEGEAEVRGGGTEGSASVTLAVSVLLGLLSRGLARGLRALQKLCVRSFQSLVR
jgi:hypothetical protein